MNELLTRLNPKVQNITDARGGFGALSPEDIEHALAGRCYGKRLPQGAYHLGRVIHVGEPIKELLFYLVNEANRSISPPASAEGKPYLRTVCEIALADILDGQTCPACNGRGVIYKSPQTVEQAKAMNDDGLLPIDCSCTDGKIRMTDRERLDIISDILDIKPHTSQWMHIYSYDYAEALSILVEWSGMVDRHLYARLDES